jgi:hypothetical protein
MMIIIIVYRTVDDDDDDYYLIRKHLMKIIRRFQVNTVLYVILFISFLCSSGKCKLYEIKLLQFNLSIHLYSHIILSLLP